jgi:hypothetical protein
MWYNYAARKDFRFSWLWTDIQNILIFNIIILSLTKIKHALCMISKKCICTFYVDVLCVCVCVRERERDRERERIWLRNNILPLIINIQDVQLNAESAHRIYKPTHTDDSPRSAILSSACNNSLHNLLTPTMTTLVITTFIKSGHWFISWTCLNLHKVSSWMEAFGAPFFSWIDIIPSSRTTQHIINFLQFWIHPPAHTLRNVVHIGAGTASESQTVQPFFNGKNISTSWTKH